MELIIRVKKKDGFPVLDTKKTVPAHAICKVLVDSLQLFAFSYTTDNEYK